MHRSSQKIIFFTLLVLCLLLGGSATYAAFALLMPSYDSINADILLMLWIVGLTSGIVVSVVRLKRSHERAIKGYAQEVEDELKACEEVLRKAQKLEAIGRITGGIAHDFNNLVTVISCNLTLLEDALGESHPLQEEVLQIRDATDRATALNKQLLGYSRRQSATDSERQLLHINDIIVDLEKIVSSMIGSNIRLETTLMQDIGFLSAAPSQLEQVILNLAINARDAMSEGGTLTFTTGTEEILYSEEPPASPIPEGRYITLTVSDTGRGMDSGVMEKAFEPFYTTKNEAGTGLGLSTIHHIVNDMGGHITVSSSIGFGTTFVLYFPVMNEENS